MRRIAVGIAMLLFGFLSAPTAIAHDEVVGTSPSNGDRLTSAPAEVRIQFSSDASLRSGERSITGPKGNSLRAGPVRIDGTTLVIPMRPTSTDGRYTVDFRAMSADEHPATGTITFELLGQTSPDATPAPTNAAPSPATDPADHGAPSWPWVIVAGVVGLGAVGLLRTFARSRND